MSTWRNESNPDAGESVSERCGTCGSLACVCFARPMTPEERAVIEAACRYRYGFGLHGLRDAVEALRESQKPKPRYVISAPIGSSTWYVHNRDTGQVGFVAACPSFDDANTIAAALNAQDKA